MMPVTRSWRYFPLGTEALLSQTVIPWPPPDFLGLRSHASRSPFRGGVARVLADRGVPAGKVLLGGFDLVPEVLQQMKAGYVQVQIDQQPYEQGFMPVMEVYLAKTVGLAPADIDTGQGIVTPDQVDSIMDLSTKGVR